MKLQVVRRYASPSYPTRAYLVEHPELLKWIPERWRQHRLVLGVLGMVIPLMVARQTVAEDTRNATTNASHVAPLFIHGDGRGAFGCVAVNPPVFLSEDEARQVVEDEAKKAGIAFAADALTLNDVEVPLTDQFDFLIEERAKEEAASGKPKVPRACTQKRDLVLDGYDRKLNIAYEVVTEKDFSEWERKDGTVGCTVSSYDFKTTAEKLTNGLTNAKQEARVAVFYEPAGTVSERKWPDRHATESERKTFWEAKQKAAKEAGEKDLREQVRDFIEWLKAQGVI